jgi:hypothetical protein
LALSIDSENFAEKLDRWRRDTAFSTIDAHPVFGEFGRAYYPAVFGERRMDVGFAVNEGDQAFVIVPCTSGERRLDYYDSPIRFFLRSGLDEPVAQRAIAKAFLHLDALAAERNVDEVVVCDDTGLGSLSVVGKQCLNRRAAAALRLNAYCALDGGEASMRRGLRKSFQSLINWGQRNLRIESIDADNPSQVLFERYQDFHAAVAGRVTRPKRSWDVMFNWIAAGHRQLLLGFLATGELVSGTMVVDGGTQAYYASGVYDRERFDHPLGHWPIWLAMLRSGERGMRSFDLGELPLPGTATNKEIAIGYFKRGFATNITTWIAWSWSPKTSKRAP